MTSSEAKTGSRWRLHDIVIGLLSGAGVGSVIAVVIAARVDFDVVVIPIGLVLGGLAGIYLLLRSHRRNDNFLNVTVVIAWVLLFLSGGWLVLLATAIANFT
jgi:hypothetical protein